MTASGRRGTARLFLGSATLSLIPVLVLGGFLAASYRTEARHRGIAEGRAEAQLIAQTSIQPFLGTGPIASSVKAHAGDLAHLSTQDQSGALRLRLRDLSGSVVFSSDRSGFSERPEDEALDAARGETVALLTHVNVDTNDTGRAGPAAVEVYLPLFPPGSSRAVGVLEVYLPYAPIRADIARSLRGLLVDLVLGLGVLYVVLFAISWSVSRGLRRQVTRNAYLAGHDALTGLPNRSTFMQQAAESIARAVEEHRSVVIAIVDLDRFNEINDSLGHDNGDTVLEQLARHVERGLDGSSTVARIGGDEFGLILEDAPDVDAALAGVRESLNVELEISGVRVTMEASVGYVIAPGDGDDVKTLVQRADVAVHVAKRQHVGVVHYDPEHDHYDPANLALIAELRRAIGANELVLNYQPKARIAGGTFESVEALVRWQHPERGLLPPDRFLPLAEQTDLIEDLTDWVLARALTDLRQLHVAAPIGMAVNVSARSLSRPDFPDRVLRAIDEAGVDPTRLTIEITETALMSDPTRAAIALSQLDAFGVKISLDDFGTGHTSLGYLSSLPIDELKIDKSFVFDMLIDRSHGAIVRSVIDLGHNLGLRVVAEGIETAEILRALGDLGCDVAQGYSLARPMPVGDLPRFFATTPLVQA